MSLIVSADGKDPSRGRAVFRGRTYLCAIGRGGISADKTEGDGVSPTGEFDIVKILYRPILPTDGWCDDPAHADYNRPVTLPHPAGAETLWRDDALYDLVAVTSHNSNPIVPGAGSAIFVHIAGGADYPPTEGCIAFARADLEAILRDWIPGRDTIAIA